MKVTVQTLNKQTKDVIVEGANVSHLRDAIVQSYEVPEDKEVKIIFSGKVLDNLDETLESVGLNDGGKVVILQKKKKVAPVKEPEPEPVKEPEPEPVKEPEPEPVKEPEPEPVKEPEPKPVKTEPSQTVQPNVPVNEPVNLFDLAAQQQAAQQQASQQESMANLFGGGQDSQGIPGVPSAAGNNPQAAMFQQLIMSNPQMVAQLLMQDPQFQQLAQQNPEAIQQLLSNPQMLQQLIGQALGGQFGEDGMGEGPGTVVTLTEEERQQLQQLVEMGVDEQEALEVYVQCGKDLNLAANILLSDMMDAGGSGGSAPSNQDNEQSSNSDNSPA